MEPAKSDRIRIWPDPVRSKPVRTNLKRFWCLFGSVFASFFDRLGSANANASANASAKCKCKSKCKCKADGNLIRATSGMSIDR